MSSRSRVRFALLPALCACSLATALAQDGSFTMLTLRRLNPAAEESRLEVRSDGRVKLSGRSGGQADLISAATKIELDRMATAWGTVTQAKQETTWTGGDSYWLQVRAQGSQYSFRGELEPGALPQSPLELLLLELVRLQDQLEKGAQHLEQFERITLEDTNEEGDYVEYGLTVRANGSADLEPDVSGLEVPPALMADLRRGVERARIGTLPADLSRGILEGNDPDTTQTFQLTVSARDDSGRSIAVVCRGILAEYGALETRVGLLVGTLDRIALNLVQGQPDLDDDAQDDDAGILDGLAPE